MAATPKLIRMIEELRDATERGRLRWEETKYVVDSFAVKLSSARITLNESFDRDGESEAWLVGVMVQGGDGRTIEFEEFREGDEGYATARDLYEVVRRNARRVDEVLDDVIAELSIGKP